MSKRVRYTEIEKAWILANTDMTVEEEYKAFIVTFGQRCTFSAFKTKRARLNDKGNKHARFTQEENEWIMQNYPSLGAEKTLKGLCERFGNRHTIKSLQTQCKYLSLNVTEQRWREACLNNGHHENVPIGTVQKRGRGQNWIKVGKGCEGWIPLTQHLLDCPEGSIIVHLDGNKANDSLENLRIVKRSINSRMVAWRMYSENPIITETGIRCCELQEALLNTDTEEI
jgi:hypothetical protein